MKRRLLLIGLGLACARPALALYDPKPDPSLAAVQGEWRGSLTYRDYSEPKRLVTLPTRLFVALSAPNELALHYVFDDGPSKTVHSYEKMKFDVTAREITWVSGQDAKAAVCRITSDGTADGARSLTFERSDGGDVKRYNVALSARSFTLAEDEIGSAGVATFRNRYEFARVGS